MQETELRWGERTLEFLRQGLTKPRLVMNSWCPASTSKVLGLLRCMIMPASCLFKIFQLQFLLLWRGGLVFATLQTWRSGQIVELVDWVLLPCGFQGLNSEAGLVVIYSYPTALVFCLFRCIYLDLFIYKCFACMCVCLYTTQVPGSLGKKRVPGALKLALQMVVSRPVDEIEVGSTARMSCPAPPWLTAAFYTSAEDWTQILCCRHIANWSVFRDTHPLF